MVYDGPALAGKTTNLKALAEKLGCEIYSGEESGGRTLYLDWVDFIGGSFEGLPIRCQIVSVPGQQVLLSRRRWLLESADVVVFVADSRPEQGLENQRAFGLLRQLLEPKDPPVGVIVQANKRDLDTALDLDAMRHQLAGEQSLAMTEAIAEEADGVRDTFILAVRLALDRVRALQARGELAHHAPEVQDGPELVASMQRRETGQLPRSAEATDLASAAFGVSGTATVPPPDLDISRGSAVKTSSTPPLPDVMVPLGHVWPPVQGRMRVHEATRGAPAAVLQGDGSWLAEGRHWLLQSPAGGHFDILEAGQSALQDWIDWHQAAAPHLTEDRCLVLMPETPTRCRLWQIVGKKLTLGQALNRLLFESEGEDLGKRLFRFFQQGQRAEQEMRSRILSSLEVESIQVRDGTTLEVPLQFAGFAPWPCRSSEAVERRVAEQRFEPHGVSSPILIEELAPVLRRELARRPGTVPGVLAGFQAAAEARNQGAVVDSLRKVLLGS